MDFDGKYALLQSILKQVGRVIVACSGGAGSPFLFKAAVDTLMVR